MCSIHCVPGDPMRWWSVKTPGAKTARRDCSIAGEDNLLPEIRVEIVDQFPARPYRVTGTAMAERATPLASSCRHRPTNPARWSLLTGSTRSSAHDRGASARIVSLDSSRLGRRCRRCTRSTCWSRVPALDTGKHLGCAIRLTEPCCDLSIRELFHGLECPRDGVNA